MGIETGIILILLAMGLAAGAGAFHNRLQLKELEAMEERYVEDEKLVEELEDYNRLLEQYREQISELGRRDGAAGFQVVQLTGHALLDALLACKREQAERAGIDLFVECERLVDWKMEERDTVALWMNLLDNAIESAGMCRNGVIRICIRKEQEWLLLRIENSKKRSETERNELDRLGKPEGSIEPGRQEHCEFRTTKEDAKAHGFGLGVVRQLIDSYGGRILVQDQGERFLVEIRLVYS